MAVGGLDQRLCRQDFKTESTVVGYVMRYDL
jgi:hypothetical protein